MKARDVQLLVLAKAPVPGLVKTRLCPPCDPVEAATIAEAALFTTLEVVADTPARRRILVLDGVMDPPPLELHVIPQRGDGLGDRLASAFDDTGAPSLLIGMDTPQVSTSLLAHAMSHVVQPGTDAVLGPTIDGGYWAIGFKEVHPEAFEGVPMSVDMTFERQLEKLTSLGLEVALLPPLVDVDYFGDALDVAEMIPDGDFASAVRRIATYRGAPA